MKFFIAFCFSLVALMGCVSTSNISHEHQSNNYNERARFLVMHYTVINWEHSLNALTKENGLSAHYLIPEEFDDTYPYDKLRAFQLVDETKRAWHAGASQWEDRKNINDQSIGIELVNRTACYAQRDNEELSYRDNQMCFYSDFSPKQIELLIEVSKGILARNPDITPTRVVAHSDIAPARKSDPGAQFPWYTLYQHGIGAWFDNETVHKYWVKFTTSAMPNLETMQCALQRYGYPIQVTTLDDEQHFNTVRAFQLHFRPWQTNGVADAKTAATLWALLEKYFPDTLSEDGELLHECEVNMPRQEENDTPDLM